MKILTNQYRCCGDKSLLDAMFRARAAVFHDRLSWNVQVRDGREIDRYDEAGDPLYLMSLDSGGEPTGSLRLLPTVGETMLGNEFAAFFDPPVVVRSDTIWECTRFCIHPRPGGDRRTNGRAISTALLMGLCDLALSRGITHIVGLYDAHMTRVYRRIGWEPRPLAIARPDVGNLIVGIWDTSQAAIQAMQARAGAVSRANPEFNKQAA